MTMASDPSADVLAYYDRYPEEERLSSGAFQLEFERTRQILTRVLPKPPARVLDVGGAAGTYSLWLASQGYEIHLVDASERLVNEARRRSQAADRPIASLQTADARHLPHPDASMSAVLVMGPLYHLTSRDDRLQALREARRVLTRPGVVVAAAISRYASALDGLVRGLLRDPAFVAIRNRDLREGQHRNETDRLDYFTTAYFHRPEELLEEVAAAGFSNVRVLGVEGPAGFLPDFEARWADPLARADIIELAGLVEAEPSIVGTSAHLLAIGSV
jgi:ubiquinone/menaquinone biosynthesis C-methylase UbiE